MIQAKIYQKNQPTTQAGRARLNEWVLEIQSQPGSIRDLETAWNATADTLRQIKLTFNSLMEAREFADNQNIRYSISTTHTAAPRRRTYAENFRRG